MGSVLRGAQDGSVAILASLIVPTKLADQLRMAKLRDLLCETEALLRHRQRPNPFASRRKNRISGRRKIGGKAGSPNPVGGLLVFRKCTSISGAWDILSHGC